MHQRTDRAGNGRADRMPRLLNASSCGLPMLKACVIAAIDWCQGSQHAGEETGVHGSSAIGYPFHPPGKPEKTRIAHFKNWHAFCVTAVYAVTLWDADDVANYRSRVAGSITLAATWITTSSASRPPAARSRDDQGGCPSSAFVCRQHVVPSVDHEPVMSNQSDNGRTLINSTVEDQQNQDNAKCHELTSK